MNSSPNYYAVIPANVRYATELSLGARLLYGEISALSNGKGYCWASNAYFAKLYNVHTDTISDWISQLYGNGLVKIADGSGKNRKITMSVKTPRIPRQKHLANVGENTEQNNIKNNLLIEEEQSKFAPALYGEVINHFIEEFKRIYDTKVPPSIPQGIIRPILKKYFKMGYSASQLKKIITVFLDSVRWSEFSDDKYRESPSMTSLFQERTFNKYLVKAKKQT